jgi:hypothetical protein
MYGEMDEMDKFKCVQSIMKLVEMLLYNFRWRLFDKTGMDCRVFRQSLPDNAQCNSDRPPTLKKAILFRTLGHFSLKF